MASPFDYVILRLVPSIERGERVNVGVIVFSRTLQFLDCEFSLSAEKLRVIGPLCNLEVLRVHLEAIQQICVGSPESGPIAALPQHERFHWLAAPRSTMLQPSGIHAGMTENVQATLEKLCKRLVD